MALRSPLQEKALLSLLKGPIRDDLIGRSAADVIEVAVDYKTGNASLKGVTQMESLIKAPYVKLEKGGNLLAVANDKLARMANAIKTSITKAFEKVKPSMQFSPAPEGQSTKQVVKSIEKEFFTSRLGKGHATNGTSSPGEIRLPAGCTGKRHPTGHPSGRVDG